MHRAFGFFLSLFGFLSFLFIIYFLVGVLIPLNFSLNELYPLSSVLCLSRKLDKLFEERFFGGHFLGTLFERRKFILICKNTCPEMISFDGIHPD